MEEKKVKSFKIVNKTKDGVIVILYGQPVNLTWKEFKEDYVMEEGRLTCHFNRKAQKRLEQADELINQGVVAAMGANSPKAQVDPQWKLSNISTLGAVTEKLHDLLGLSLEEVANLIQTRINLLNKHIKKPRTDKKQKQQDKPMTEDRPKFGATVTLGDLPAMQELKKKYGL